MPAILFLSLPTADETTRSDPSPQVKHEAVSGTTGRHPFDDALDQVQLGAQTHAGGGPATPFRLP